MNIHPKHISIRPTEGIHDVYIFRDKESSFFKIGMTVGHLEDRRKAVCRYVYNRRSYDKIVTHSSWQVQDFFATLFLERALIGIIRRFGYEQVREQDWFAVDVQTMEVVIRMVDDIAYEIRLWEKDNFGLKCDAIHLNFDRPYCIKAYKIGREELTRRAQLKSGAPR